MNVTTAVSRYAPGHRALRGPLPDLVHQKSACFHLVTTRAPRKPERKQR